MNRESEPQLAMSCEVIIVDDHPLYRAALKGAVSAACSAGTFHEADSVASMFDTLECHPNPDLLLLDLNLPRKDGREVLREMKDDESLRRIPVVVLTTSLYPQDVTNAYNLNANSYIAKPVDLDQFIEVIKSVYHFWRHVARLPKD